MQIHVEPVVSILRVYFEGSYDNKDSFDFVTTLVSVDEDTAILKAGLGKVNSKVVLEILRHLKGLGYSSCKAYRNGKWKTYDLNKVK